jgi:CHAD domain-containing protein
MLAQQRRQSRQPIQAQLKKLEAAGWSSRVDRLIEVVSGRRRRTGFRAFARRRFKPMVVSFVDTVDRALRDHNDIHSLRIKGKKLRYAMEIFATVFPAGAGGRCQKSLERLQDMLGECTDHASAADRLHHWSRSINAGPNQEMLVAWSGDEKEKANRSRKAFATWWNRTRRRSLQRRLNRTLRRSA